MFGACQAGRDTQLIYLKEALKFHVYWGSRGNQQMCKSWSWL